jgi:hypothetical protein
MCGIVGVVSGNPHGVSANETDAFTKMLYVDTLRGWDSTGVFSVNNYNNVQIHKAALAGPDFIRTQEYAKFTKEAAHEALILVGHNRAATRGTIKDANAHPFWVDNNIILVQNGTYYGSHDHIKKTEVDTEALAHLFAEQDDEIKAIQEINAAYVLVWYNVKKRTLYITRNDDRPLYIAKSPGNSLFFASEKETLEWVQEKNALRYNSTPYMVAPHVLVKIAFDAGGDYELDNIDVPQKPKAVVLYPFHGTFQTYEDVPWKNKTPAPHYTGRGATGTIESTIREFIRDSRPELLLSSEELASTREAFDHFCKRTAQEQQKVSPTPSNKTSALIALTDYSAANNHPNCTAWHVWGQIVTADPAEDVLQNLIVHWFLHDKDEAEALQYVTRGYYETTLTTLVTEKSDKDYVLTVFGANPQPLVPQ